MRLTEDMLLARAKTSNLASIKRINLSGFDLTDISIVEDMSNVELLSLSINKLSNLQPLAACSKLQFLYLRKNNIHDFEELKHLQNLSDLKELWLGENPCAENAGLHYRSTVVKMLPNLKKLDDKEITTADIEGAKKLNGTKVGTKQLVPEAQPERVIPPAKVQSAPEPKKTPEKQETDLIEFEIQQQIENINSMQKKVPDLPWEVRQPPQRELPYFPQQSPAEAYASGFETQRSRQSLPASFNQMAPVEESQESPVTIAQLKVILQIQQPQQTQTKQQRMSHECPDWNKPGSRSSRTRVSQGLNNDSGWYSFTSRTNQENKAQRGHQFDGPQASNRVAHINENLTWGDGLNTHRCSASRTKSSASRSSRPNANVCTALLCFVPELDLQSLQVLEHSVQCRLDELSNQSELTMKPKKL